MLRYPIAVNLGPRSSFGASQPHGRIRIVLPPARRQAHTSCGRQGRRDASPRGSAEFSASRHSLEQRRGAAAEEFLKSRVSSIPYRNNSVVSSRRLKHLLLPRAVPRNVPRPAIFWRAPRRSFSESPASCTEEQRGEFSVPKAFVLHAARRDEVRAGGPTLVPPRSHPSPKH